MHPALLKIDFHFLHTTKARLWDRRIARVFRLSFAHIEAFDGVACGGVRTVVFFTVEVSFTKTIPRFSEQSSPALVYNA